MKNYVGTKHIKARPMTWGEYIEYKKDIYNETIKSPKNRTPDIKGYLVGYPAEDGKTFDGKLEAGCRYVSWSPKNIFEGVYKRIED